MIKNERQYRITKAQLERLHAQLGAVDSLPRADLHPLILKAQRDALVSQTDELRAEIAEYEALQRGRSKVLEVSSFEQLPDALVGARIAAGLTQRDLARKLGLKEQQVQRYEATAYETASFQRLKEVVAALGVRVREEVFLADADVSLKRVVRRTTSAGFGKSFVQKRILGATRAASTEESLALRAASVLNRIFGWPPAILFGDEFLPFEATAMAGARFKLPSNASLRGAEAYATYAFYVARLILRATPTLESRPVPIDPAVVRDGIRAIRGDLSFESTLDYIWSLGIAVLPLDDSGTFHSAAWRIAGRNVMVLKQGNRSTARWMYDALHELRHLGEEPDASELAFLDYEKLPTVDGFSEEETTAMEFAGDVALDGKAEAMARKCVTAAGGRLERLKSAVSAVAAREGVSVGSLANYMAHRLSMQGESWWGAAANLQETTADPWLVTRDLALAQLDLRDLDEPDRAVLLAALSEGSST